MNQQQFIQRSCELAGGATKLASALGITPSAITQWGLPESDKFFRRVPAERCPQIEAATNGLVRCEDLRPDVAWSVLRATPPQAQPLPPISNPAADVQALDLNHSDQERREDLDRRDEKRRVREQRALDERRVTLDAGQGAVHV